MKIKYLTKKQDDRDKLLELVNFTDSFFQPALSKRVDLQSYVDKMLEEGIVIVFSETVQNKENFIAGCSFYCNPHKYDYAFLTYIAATQRGLGSKLLKRMIEYCIKEGSKGIETQTWESNSSSLKLFTRNGFKKIKSLDNRETNEKSIFLRLDFSSKS